MKKWLVLLVVSLLAIAAVIPVAAGTPNPHANAAATGSHGYFQLIGKITAFDTEANTVTVLVLRGNKLVKPFIGTEVTITVDTSTVFHFKKGTNATLTDLSGLVIGNPVSINGKIVDDVWTARLINMTASLKSLH